MEQTVRQQLSDYIVAHQEEFYRLAYSYVKNRDAALDVVQESIVKALAKSDTLRRPEYLKAWFYRILLNESMNHHRRAKRLVPLEDTLLETPAPARDPGERLDRAPGLEGADRGATALFRGHEAGGDCAGDQHQLEHREIQAL